MSGLAWQIDGERFDVESPGVGDGAADIGDRNEFRALAAKETGRVFADGAEALQNHARALERKAGEAGRDIGCNGDAEARGADLVQEFRAGQPAAPGHDLLLHHGDVHRRAAERDLERPRLATSRIRSCAHRRDAGIDW